MFNWRVFTLLGIFFVSGVVFSFEIDPETPLVYLTWRKDPKTTMTIQWISEDEKGNDDVLFREIGANKWMVTAGTHIPLPQSDTYFIHRVELTNLSPDKSYQFRVGRERDQLYKFRTMPKTLEKPVRFVVGGDMYHDAIEYLEETNKQAAKADPMFALIGGDIAYAEGSKPTETKKNELKRWLQWLSSWAKHMVTPEGYLIPFIPSIGNHDTNGSFDQPKKNAPFFYSLFAYPGSQGFNVLDFGDYMSIITLDSGHTNSIPGTQTNWLQSILQQRQGMHHKFAVYHVPAYPSYRKFNDPYHVQIRENWVPIFEKFSLSAAFEHHDHTYKRTHPILNNKVDPDGVIYLGDGAWGLKKPRKPKKLKNTWYLAQAYPERHFILVTLNGMNRRYQAVKPNGEVFDTYDHVIKQEEPISIAL